MTRRSYTHIFPLLALLLLSAPVLAQIGMRYETGKMIQSGTGFFVNRNGHIITNAHVVAGCKRVTARGYFEEAPGDVIASDPELDLAIIRIDRFPVNYPPLRENIEAIEKEEGVVVMGYPMESGLTGEYQVAEAKVIDVKGPTGEPKWLQFTDSARQGNSGGPLLDGSGNVIGVVTGKATLYQVDELGREKLISNSDVAISIRYLRDFLDLNHVYYRITPSYTRLTSNHIETQAKNYIVNIHCIPEGEGAMSKELNAIMQ